MVRHIKQYLRKKWIWVWYNDITRIFVVLLPTYFIVLIPILGLITHDGILILNILKLVYIGVIFWAILDNDYNKLNEIGLDVYRNPLKRKK